MGADDDYVKESTEDKQIDQTRKKYNIDSEDFLIVTGGKIDLSKKQTLILMKVIKDISDKKIKLIIFGPVHKELKNDFQSLVDMKRIIHLDWVSAKEAYLLFGASNLVIFPGRHSVYWEQAAGIGKPLIVKFWRGTQHIDQGGNCKFIYKDSYDEFFRVLNLVIKNNKILLEMSKNALIFKENFSYLAIAKRSIQ